MIKLLYFVTIYYKKNKKSRYTILSLTILFLLITNLFNQYTKSTQYLIKLYLPINLYQLSNDDRQVSFLKRFISYSAAKYIEEYIEKEKFRHDYNYNINLYSLTLNEKTFLSLVKHLGFNPETFNLNNTGSYKNLKNEMTKKFNLFIKNETIKKLRNHEKIFKTAKTLLVDQIHVSNQFLNYIDDITFLTVITQSDDMISLEIEKNFRNTLSLNHIILLNFFILCLPLFFPYLLTIFRKLRSFN